jgi:hypothetical protein
MHEELKTKFYRDKMAQTGNKLEDFAKLEKIGEGTYGVVFKGKNKRTGEIGKTTDIIVDKLLAYLAVYN